MRIIDLSPDVVRLPAHHVALYVPPARPAPRPRRIRKWLSAIAIFAMAATVSAGRIGDQSALAALEADAPSWAATLRAPDPGVALSPHIEAGSVVTAVGPHTPDVPAKKDASRMPPDDEPRRAMFSPAGGVFASADPDVLPRMVFVPAKPPAKPRRSASKQDAAREEIARATLTSMLTAYAPTRPDMETPFDLLLGSEEAKAEAEDAQKPYGVSGGGLDHWWSDRPLPAGIASETSRRCLAEAIYFEARSENLQGQRAVAQVVINRVKNPAYPDDVCGVVYQNKDWHNRCQFTFACDRVKDVIRDQAAWKVAKAVAAEYTSGKMWLDEIGAATHYHAQRVSPSWAKTMRHIKNIEGHAFYITRNGGWT